MRRFAAILLASILFSTAFAVGGGDNEKPRWADSLRSVYLYTEGVKQRIIARDTLRAEQLFREAIEADSLYAPAYFEMVLNRLYNTPEEGVEMARRAHRIDSTNKWYHRLYGQMLLMTDRFEEALPLYQSLIEKDKEADNYRILAALYQQLGRPYSAIATLDSAEVRFGRIPYLSRMKRQLLASTNQHDKAIQEAQALVDTAPYEAEHHVVLAELYALKGEDSLARTSYNAALAIDSTNLQTLMSLSDFFNAKRDYRSMLWVTERMFRSDELPLDVKVQRFEIFTSDIEFYRNNYPQINNLAYILSIRHPNDNRVVRLFADHQIASGRLEQALAHYKQHANDEPPVADYYEGIIELESYLERPDSALQYIDRAIKRFPDRNDFQLMRGQVFYHMKDYDRAVQAYRRALKQIDSDSLRSAVWGQIGDVYHAKGEQEKGFLQDGITKRKCYDAYRKALKYNPDNILVLNNWAYFLAVENRDLERALTMSDRVQELSPKNPTYMDTQAWILFRMGRLEEARPILRQAIALDGHRSAELLVHYGDVLHALGEQYLAETYWKRALERGYDKAVIEQRLAQPPVKK